MALFLLNEFLKGVFFQEDFLDELILVFLLDCLNRVLFYLLDDLVHLLQWIYEKLLCISLDIKCLDDKEKNEQENS